MSSLEMDQEMVLDRVKSAMIEYYTLLCSMPHMEPACLRIPPPSGWSSIDTEALLSSGRSEAAIDFLCHIPYLAPCQNSKAV